MTAEVTFDFLTPVSVLLADDGVARDGGRTRFPAEDDRAPTRGVVVARPPVDSALPLLDWYIAPADHASLTTEVGSKQYRPTVVVVDGVVYDGVRARLQGGPITRARPRAEARPSRPRGAGRHVGPGAADAARLRRRGPAERLVGFHLSHLGRRGSELDAPPRRSHRPTVAGRGADRGRPEGRPQQPEPDGAGPMVGALNVLLWLSYIITTSLYAFAFGSYGATFFSDATQGAVQHLLISAVILGMAVLNVFSAKFIAFAEDYIVAGKLVILLAFVGVALFDSDLSAAAPSEWAGTGSLLAGGMLIFVAYEGFELIANSAHDVRDPARTIPRALYTSVIFTIVLYMLVAVVTVGLLSLAEISKTADFALAEAAQVVWGGLGFGLIVVAALLSTASAINATLYGTTRLSIDIAVDGELPTDLERKIAGKPIVGLLAPDSMSTTHRSWDGLVSG